MTPLIVLDDHNFQEKVLSNQQVINEFPFLINAKTTWDAVKSCKPCQRAEKGMRAKAAMMEAKKMIAEMPLDRKARFRELLDARQIRINWFDAANNRQRVDF